MNVTERHEPDRERHEPDRERHEPDRATAGDRPLAAEPPLPPDLPAEPVAPVEPVDPTAEPAAGDAPAAPIAPGGPPGTPAGRGPSPWPRLLAIGLAALLAGGVGHQSWRLHQVSDELAATAESLQQLTREWATGEERLTIVEERTGELERTAGEAFDPEAIATAVLPSVFKVVAGDFTGTGFAVGGPADGGGTNLFTNYHVVEQVWLSGDREVFLERAGQRFPAEIVDVDRGADVAWLHADSAFSGLVAASGEVRTGQPIVSVGAPLGLGDTLTTGVVSNTDRRLPDGSGPWIQFDAAVEPGNSGGPVINAAQQVVGIATRKATDFEGIGFAVPIGDACALFDICGDPDA